MGRFYRVQLGRRRGFSLIELMVVLGLTALVTALVAYYARPSAQQQLMREGDRLAIWFEAVRVQARVQNLPIQARNTHQGFELLGATPPGDPAPKLLWLYPSTQADINSPTLWMGPEPILPAQSLWLQHLQQPDVRVEVASNGVGPWQVQR